MVRARFFRAVIGAAVLGVPLGAGVFGRDQPPDVSWDMSLRIDQRLQKSWATGNIEPAEIAGDAEFVRRVFLDVRGVLPTAGEVRQFLASSDANKRARLVDQLLSSPLHAQHLADLWTRILLGTGPERPETEQLNRWLFQRFSVNLRYDRLVADLLAASGVEDSGPVAYYQAMEFKPEKLAASSAEIFLGIRLQCAQCHDHPFDDWKQTDFWGLAAFFARVGPRQSSMQRVASLVDRTTGEVTLPEKPTVVYPRFPSGRDADLQALGTRRQWLALWMASPENRFLARAAVNRVWGQLFGTGLVDPVDDMGPANPASHPQLLDELSEWFVQSGYDLRELYRAILNSSAYQRSSRYATPEIPSPQTFAVMATKPLTAEQVQRSLVRMAHSEESMEVPALIGARLRQMQSANGQLQASVPQALMMMNGRATQVVTAGEASRIVHWLSAPFFTPTEKLEILFLSTVSRPPTDEEQQRLLPLLATDQQAAADILWALLNSAEFLLNH